MRTLIDYIDLYAEQYELKRELALLQTSYENWSACAQAADAHAAADQHNIENLQERLARLTAHLNVVERQIPSNLSHHQYTTRHKKHKGVPM